MFCESPFYIEYMIKYLWGDVMNSKIEIITKDKIKTSNWSGGTTNEIYIYPENSNYKALNFSWRISSATVDLEHSTFTSLPNIYRYITTLEGSMDLCHNKGPLIHLNPFEVHGFSGDLNTESFGKVIDFNLMLGPGCDGVMDVLFSDSISPLKINLHKENISSKSISHIFFSSQCDLYFLIEDEKLYLPKWNALIIHEYLDNSNSNIEITSQEPCKLISITTKVPM